MLCHRVVVLIGVALIVWATPRLARRCGVAEVSALWLGAANPLLIMHLVAGIHNEALMLGLMLTGAEFALRGIDSAAAAAPRRGGIGPDWEPLGMLLAGAILITLSSQVKLPSLLALGFVTMALAYRCGGNLRALLLAGGAMAALSLAVMALVGWASGLGFGWIYTLGTANVVRSWMSPPTLLALGTGQVGILLGLGDHTTAVLALTRAIGVLIIMVMVTWLLLAVFRGRLHPIGGLGVALGITVLLFPVVQPWYLLWAIIPLAAWATRTGLPGGRDRHHPRRRHLRPDRQRRPLRAVPDRGRHLGQHRHRGGAHRADVHPLAVATAAAQPAESREANGPAAMDAGARHRAPGDPPTRADGGTRRLR